MKVPIPNTIENQLDPAYRYMRDTLNISKQGQFYVLNNIEIISKQLNISIEHIKFYLTNKLKQPIIIDKKNNTFKIKNLPVEFDKYFEEYITQFVICDNCLKPELDNNNICNCCGTIKKKL